MHVHCKHICKKAESTASNLTFPSWINVPLGALFFFVHISDEMNCDDDPMQDDHFTVEELLEMDSTEDIST
jgi:hypothetical protein